MPMQQKGMDKMTGIVGAIKKKNRRSIIGLAKENIFEFPVFVADTYPLDYATATVSLLEQVNASFLQMAISTNPIVTKDQITLGTQFGGFKTDTSKYLEHFEPIKIDTSKYVDYTNMEYAHEAAHNTITTKDGVTMEFSMVSITDETAGYINEGCDHQPLSEFDSYFQEAGPGGGYMQFGGPNQPASRHHIDTKTGLTPVETRERALASIRGDERAREIADAREARDAEAHVARNIDDNIMAAIDHKTAEINQLEAIKDDRALTAGEKMALGQAHEELHNMRRSNAYLDLTRAEKTAKAKVGADQAKEARDRMVKPSEVLKDQDYQKLNTMKPLMMNVELRVDEAGGQTTPYTFQVGVKCHVRRVPSSMLPEVAQYPLKEMNKISRKARWRAGELKFFKDILFRVKEKKQTAIDSLDPNRKWFRRLYELAHTKGDAVSAMGITGEFETGGVIPNCSMLITKADVDFIKAETDIDLLDPSTASQFCRDLFLIAFVVADVDGESIKILLPDLHNDFEIHSLASVNKQLATLDTAGTKTRDMFKLLG